MDFLKKYWVESLLVFMTAMGILLAIFMSSEFLRLTPLYILFNLSLLLYRVGLTRKVLYMLGIAAFIGYFAELIGVKTGIIFGDYIYGTVLGPKIFEVPLLIGFMWGLVMLSVWMILPVKKLGWKSIPAAGIFAVLYDIALEHFATRFDLWGWAGSIPLSNAIGWFITASFIATAFYVRKATLEPLLIAYVTLLVHTVFFTLTVLVIT